MGRTIPSFRLALVMERQQWKVFRDTLDGIEERKQFDEMFDIPPRLYLSACSYASHNVRIYPILVSILLHNYKQLADCTAKVQKMADKLEEEVIGKGTNNQKKKKKNDNNDKKKNEKKQNNVEEEGDYLPPL